MLSSQRSRVPSLNFFLSVPKSLIAIWQICIFIHIQMAAWLHLHHSCHSPMPRLTLFFIKVLPLRDIYSFSPYWNMSQDFGLICSLLGSRAWISEWHIVCPFPTDSKCHLYHVLDPCLHVGLRGLMPMPGPKCCFLITIALFITYEI